MTPAGRSASRTRLPSRVAAAIGAVLGLALPAGAAAPLSPQAQPAVPDPSAVPGFLDPATGNFTPLASSGAAAGTPISGNLSLSLNVDTDPNFSDKSTIMCTVTISFGNVVNGQFFSNHGASASFSFAAGDGGRHVDIPYSYTPNSPNAKMQTTISCSGYDKGGTFHSETNAEPLEDVAEGGTGELTGLHL